MTSLISMTQYLEEEDSRLEEEELLCTAGTESIFFSTLLVAVPNESLFSLSSSWSLRSILISISFTTSLSTTFVDAAEGSSLPHCG